MRADAGSPEQALALAAAPAAEGSGGSQPEKDFNVGDVADHRRSTLRKRLMKDRNEPINKSGDGGRGRNGDDPGDHNGACDVPADGGAPPSRADTADGASDRVSGRVLKAERGRGE